MNMYPLMPTNAGISGYSQATSQFGGVGMASGFNSGINLSGIKNRSNSIIGVGNYEEQSVENNLIL